MPRIQVRGAAGPPVTYRFDQDRIAVGRSTGCDLVVDDPELSRLHAEIVRDGDRWLVRDRDSRNGTERNGRRLRGAEPLAPGDEVRVGSTVLTFEPLPGAEPHGGRGVGAGSEHGERPTWAARPGEPSLPRLVGGSPAIRELLRLIDKVAPSPATVLLTGESGTGKELVARLIHLGSPRAAGPFAAVNCPALPGSLLEAELFGVERGVATGVEARPGRFETAARGTLFLDEIGDMDLAAQAKILRVLQERQVERLGGRAPIAVDVRVIAATHHDLEADIARGTFRRDLYHRLNVVTLELPALRERREDIAPLARHFLDREGPGTRLGEDALACLLGYDFPGNVRELEHLMVRARLLAEGEAIEPRDLPESVRGAAAPVPAVASAGSGGTPTADELHRRVVEGGESFWTVVAEPFLRRQVSRDEVRKLIERAYAEAGGSYKEVARRFGIAEQHKKLLNFLRNHELGVGR